MEEALAAFNRALGLLDSLPPGAVPPDQARQIRQESLEGRAGMLMSLCQFSEALIAFDRAVEIAEPDEVELMAGSRLVCRMAAEFEQRLLIDSLKSNGSKADHAKAMRLANYLVDYPGVSREAVYNAACVFSLASRDEKADAVERERRAARAVALLERIAAAKYFEGAKHAKELGEDPDLNPLRTRQHFRGLAARVVKGTGR